jgi:hypothetical protein
VEGPVKLVRGFVMVEGYGDLLMILLGDSARSVMVFVMAEVLGV